MSVGLCVCIARWEVCSPVKVSEVCLGVVYVGLPVCVCGAELGGRSVARCRSVKCAYESCVSVCVCVVQSSVGGLWPGVGQ